LSQLSNHGAWLKIVSVKVNSYCLNDQHIFSGGKFKHTNKDYKETRQRNHLNGLERLEETKIRDRPAGATAFGPLNAEDKTQRWIAS
jgi:hypothetical protein